jgi:hypothetical protein
MHRASWKSSPHFPAGAAACAGFLVGIAGGMATTGNLDGWLAAGRGCAGLIDLLPEARLPVLRPSVSEGRVNDDIVPTRGHRNVIVGSMIFRCSGVQSLSRDRFIRPITALKAAPTVEAMSRAFIGSFLT